MATCQSEANPNSEGFKSNSCPHRSMDPSSLSTNSTHRLSAQCWLCLLASFSQKGRVLRSNEQLSSSLRHLSSSSGASSAVPHTENSGRHVAGQIDACMPSDRVTACQQMTRTAFKGDASRVQQSPAHICRPIAGGCPDCLSRCMSGGCRFPTAAELHFLHRQ